jgi:hypothetical protein
MLDIQITQSGAVTTMSLNGPLKVLVTSDVHIDSAFCNRKQFFADLDRAVEMDMAIIFVGDMFDAMNGRFDPRRDMSRLRPEYRREDYYDVIVDDAVRLLTPYAEHILLASDGNHELSVLKNANTDLIGRLIEKLSTNKHTVVRGGYGGIIMVKQGSARTPIKYFHGSGGEAPVTRGAIQTNRQAVFLPDFNVILNGHSHHAYWIPVVRERVSPEGVQYFDIQHHVRTPGYLMSYGDGTGGWEVTRGGIPKPVGSCLLSITGDDILATPLIHAPKPVSPVVDLYDGVVYPQE